MTRVLIAGGGVAALEATLALRDLAGDRVEIELLAPEVDFVYRPMSVAEPFDQGEAWSYPLDRLVDLAGARLTRATLDRVDLDARRAVTTDGAVREWDVLLLAIGARMGEGVPGGLTFRGPDDHGKLAQLVDEAIAGRFGSLTFALPTRVAWSLPLYELALMTQVRLEDEAATAVQIQVITPEEEPLALFGREVSGSIKRTLQTRGIGIGAQTTPVAFRNGALEVIPRRAIRTERVVSLPVPEGRDILGIPRDSHGFVRTDQFGRLAGRNDVYAAGDVTMFPLKQGGIATQQADAAAEAIAALAGAPVTPRPFRPELRGLLLTGLTPRYLAASLLNDSSDARSEPLWWPGSKIVGRYLTPFLANVGSPREPGLQEAA